MASKKSRDKKIRIGNQTSRSAKSMWAPFDYARACGFDAFEWFSDRHGEWGFDYSLLDETDCQRIRDIGVAEGIRYSIHPPVSAIATSPGGQERLKVSLKFAQAIGAKVVVVHMEEKVSPKDFAAALKAILAGDPDGTAKLAVENVPAAGPELFNELFQIVKKKSLRNRVGMCFDLGHANLFEQTRNDYLSYMAWLGDHVPVIHAHVHENRGDGDTHLPLFTGPAGEDASGVKAWVDWLLERKFAGSMIMEVWPRPAALLCETRARLQKMIHTPDKKANTSSA